VSKRRAIARLLAGGLAVAVALAPAVRAAAAPAPLPSPFADDQPARLAPTLPVPVVEQWLENALSLRLARLADLQAMVGASRVLTPTERAELTGILDGASAGIEALAAKVPADATLASLRADDASMVVDYRVFAVVSPQVTGVLGAAALQARVTAIAAVEPGIAAAIAAAREPRRLALEAQATDRELAARVATARSELVGQPAALLGLDPASYPGSRAVLAAAAAASARARADLAAAHSDLQRLTRLLATGPQLRGPRRHRHHPLA